MVFVFHYKLFLYYIYKYCAYIFRLRINLATLNLQSNTYLRCDDWCTHIYINTSKLVTGDAMHFRKTTNRLCKLTMAGPFSWCTHTSCSFHQRVAQHLVIVLFPVATVRVWNSLPSTVRHSSSITIFFCGRFEATLFEEGSFPPWHMILVVSIFNCLYVIRPGVWINYCIVKCSSNMQHSNINIGLEVGLIWTQVENFTKQD